MKLEDYKSFVERKKMRIHSRLKLSDGYSALISDGKSPADEEHDALHYKTMYAFERDGEVYVGEFYTTPALIEGVTSKDDRMVECEDRAREQFINFRNDGCLK